MELGFLQITEREQELASVWSKLDSYDQEIAIAVMKAMLTGDKYGEEQKEIVTS